MPANTEELVEYPTPRGDLGESTPFPRAKKPLFWRPKQGPRNPATGERTDTIGTDGRFMFEPNARVDGYVTESTLISWIKTDRLTERKPRVEGRRTMASMVAGGVPLWDRFVPPGRRERSGPRPGYDI
jgi:hypothetical protein